MKSQCMGGRRGVVKVVKQTELPKSTLLEKKKDYLWYNGASHCAYVGKSISWAVIGCW